MLMMLRAERDNELCNHVVSNCNKQNIHVASATRCIAVRFRERAVGLLLFGFLECAGYRCGIENVPYQRVVWGTCRVTRCREKGWPDEHFFHPPFRPSPSQPTNVSVSLPLPHRVPSAAQSCETPRAPHYARKSLLQILRTIKRNGTQKPCSWAATPDSAACYRQVPNGYPPWSLFGQRIKNSGGRY